MTYENIDGIEIDRNVKNLNHICCDCRLKHKIKVEWLEHSVILKFKRDDKIGQVEAEVKADNSDQIPKPEWKTLLTWLVDKIAIEDKPKLSKGSAITMIKYLEDLISKC